MSGLRSVSGLDRNVKRWLIAGGLILVTVLALSRCAGSGDAAEESTVTTTVSEAATSSETTTGDTTSATDPAGVDTTSTTPTSSLAPGSDQFGSPLEDPVATGRELAQRFLDILSAPDPRPRLEAFLSPAFQLQRSNGTFANKAEYLDAPATVARFTIAEDSFRAYQDGRTLVVRFSVEIQETIDGQEQRVTKADRLGVFQRGPDGWQLVAWANFNPVAPAP